MTGYSPQFSNISAKSNDIFLSSTTSNMCIFWNFVIDFVLKEIKNAKNIVIWPFYWCFKQRSVNLILKNIYIRAILIFAHPSSRKKAIFAQSVPTKIGKYFLNLLDTHFPPHHKFHKIFNRNSVKISYSCTKNIKSIINNHNNKILNDKKELINERKCNCIPLNGKCLSRNTFYEAPITSNEPNYKENKYIGISEHIFKKRYANHQKSFQFMKI